MPLSADEFRQRLAGADERYLNIRREQDAASVRAAIETVQSRGREKWERPDHKTERLLVEEILCLRTQLTRPSQGRPHRTVTPEEYTAMPIAGWHRVCRNVDGAGNVGVAFRLCDTPSETLSTEPSSEAVVKVFAAARRATSVNHDNPGQLRAAIEDLATALGLAAR